MHPKQERFSRRDFLRISGAVAGAAVLAQCAPPLGVPQESTVDVSTPPAERTPTPVLTPTVTPAELRVTATPAATIPSEPQAEQPSYNFFELRGQATDFWGKMDQVSHLAYTTVFKDMLNREGYAPIYSNVDVNVNGAPQTLPSIVTIGKTDSGQRVAQVPVLDNLFDPTLPDTDTTTFADQQIVKIANEAGIESYGIEGTTVARTKVLTTVNLTGWSENVIAVSAVVLDPNRAGGRGAQRILLIDTAANTILGDMQGAYEGGAPINYVWGQGGPEPYEGFFKLEFSLRPGVRKPEATVVSTATNPVPQQTETAVEPTAIQPTRQPTPTQPKTVTQPAVSTEVPLPGPTATPLAVTEAPPVMEGCPRTDARQNGWAGRPSGETVWIGDWPNSTDFREFTFQVLGRVTAVTGDGVDVTLNSFDNPIFRASWPGAKHVSLSGASITILKPMDQWVAGQSPECAIGWGYNPGLFSPGDELIFNVRPLSPVDPASSASIQGAIDVLVSQPTLNAFFALINQ